MAKKVYHMAYYASSFCSSDYFHQNAVIRFKTTLEISDMQLRSKKKEPNFYIKIPFLVS